MYIEYVFLTDDFNIINVDNKNMYKLQSKGGITMSEFYELLLDSIEFYAQFGWSKQKTYKYLKDNFLNYKNVKYIQNKKHRSTLHFK